MSRVQYDPGLLYPLEGPVKRRKFATWDIESKDGASQAPGFTRPFMVGLYDGKRFNAFFDQTSGGGWGRRYYAPGGCVDRFMNAALSDCYRGYWFYAHNAGNFDFLFILPWLARHAEERGLVVSLIPVGNSGLLAIDVWESDKKWSKWRFCDSVKLLPMALKDACKAFGVTAKYLDDDGSRVLDENGDPFTLACPESDPGWIPYNRGDCVKLYRVLEKGHDMVERVFGGEVGLTAPSTSIKTFRRRFLKEPVERDVGTHAFVRASYVGGRTEVIWEVGDHLRDYDVNGSYQASMLKPMPAGGARHWGASEPPAGYRQNLVGFCHVVVHVPESCELPPLPVRASDAWFPKDSGVDGKLVFPVGYLDGIWEWDELQNAVECGCEILEWKESWWYDAKPLLAEFVEVLYRYRDQMHCFSCHGELCESPRTSRGGGDPFWCPHCHHFGYDAALDAWAKLLMNSGYGRFAMRPDRIRLYWRNDPNRPDGCYPLVDGDEESQLWVAEEESDDPTIMPQISARITALSRVLLHRFAMQALSRVNRVCSDCHSVVTFHGKKRGTGWVLGEALGGAGPHGDFDHCFDHGDGDGRIDAAGALCPCGGVLETRQCRVYYMDTDSLMTDAWMASSAAVGALKDEIPRYSGFLEGRFYAPKLYRLSVDPAYSKLAEPLRRSMLMRDKKHLEKIGSDDEALARSLADDSWDRVKAKGISRDLRKKENLEKLYAGALERIRWLADPENSRRQMPDDVRSAGTIVDRRLEKVGTMARLVKRSRDGKVLFEKRSDGSYRKRSDAFGRGPLMVDVPKRLHLEGAKRIHQRDGSTRPYLVDMRGDPPDWWLDREKRREARKLALAEKAALERRVT